MTVHKQSHGNMVLFMFAVAWKPEIFVLRPIKQGPILLCYRVIIFVLRTIKQGPILLCHRVIVTGIHTHNDGIMDQHHNR